jgi:hypothetical protein
MEDDKSKVGELDDKLYSRTRYQDPLDKRSPVRELDAPPPVEGKWQSPPLEEILNRERLIPVIHPFMRKFFVFAILFFVATIIVAGAIFLGGSNFISSKNVDVNIVGPTSASAGEAFELGVTVKNSNNSDLEGVKLSIQYPQGARDPASSGDSLTFKREDLGVIPAGDEVVRNIGLVLIGSRGEVKQIKFSVEYKVKGSNATFYKDKLYDITIGDSPLSLTVESPPTVTSGDEFTTTVSMVLNSPEVLKNVMLRAEYPYGYSVISATPAAVAENNVWALGDFGAGARKTVRIRGRLVGENQEERTFRFYLGVSDNGSLSPDFKSVVVSTQNTVEIERPSLSLSANFNGENAPIYVAPAARSISTAIKFQNNMPDKLLNPTLSVRLTGAVLDRASVVAQQGGFYDSANNRVVWNLSNGAEVRELLPGQGGTVNLSFASLPQTSITGANRDIALELTLTGTPVGGRPVTVSESRTVRIASQVNLSSKNFYSIGPFKNTGPIPPKVESETTYTIVWNAGNTQDDIANAKVTARLGPGVKWIAAHSVSSESLSYDSGANTVTWDLSQLSSGSGFSTSGREVAFQVGLTPSISQIGTAPVLVSGITFSGVNTVSGNTVTVTNSPLTTRLTADPSFIQGNDIVVKK